MAKQSMGGCKKRRRMKLIREQRVLIRDAHHKTRANRHKKYGHSYTRGEPGYSVRKWPQIVEREQGVTFDEDYKTFRKTRGRRGLNPNPDYRGTENPSYLARNSVFACRRVPMVELMERAILAHEASRMA